MNLPLDQIEFLPQQLESFMRTHPLIRIDLEERSSPEIALALLEGRADLRVVNSAHLLQGLRLHNLFSDPLDVEYLSVAVKCWKLAFDGLPEPHNGVLRLLELPGLGFAANRDRIAELARRLLSRGAGKA